MPRGGDPQLLPPERRGGRGLYSATVRPQALCTPAGSHSPMEKGYIIPSKNASLAWA